MALVVCVGLLAACGGEDTARMTSAPREPRSPADLRIELDDEPSAAPAVVAEFESLGLECEFNLGGDDFYTVAFALGGNLGKAKEEGSLSDADAERISTDLLSRFDPDDLVDQYLCISPDGGYDMDSAFTERMDELDRILELDPDDPEYQRYMDEQAERMERLTESLQEAMEDPDGFDPDSLDDVLDHVEGVDPLGGDGGSYWVGQVIHLSVVDEQGAWASPSGEWSQEQTDALMAIADANRVVVF